MDWNDNSVEIEKTKLFTKIGCLIGVFIFVLLAISVVVWYVFSIFSYQEKTLELSHSPNNINSIEIVMTNDFPDPTIKIKYDDKSIMKTKIPDEITVEWKNDYQAIVILAKQGREPDIVDLEFGVNHSTEK